MDDDHLFVTVASLLVALMVGGVMLCTFDVTYADRLRDEEALHRRQRARLRKELAL